MPLVVRGSLRALGSRASHLGPHRQSLRAPGTLAEHLVAPLGNPRGLVGLRPGLSLACPALLEPGPLAGAEAPTLEQPSLATHLVNGWPPSPAPDPLRLRLSLSLAWPGLPCPGYTLGAWLATLSSSRPSKAEPGLPGLPACLPASFGTWAKVFFLFFQSSYQHKPLVVCAACREREGGVGGLRRRGPRPGTVPTAADKSLDRGLTFNRSQRRSCSATYETPTQNQVVCKSFSTRFSTNMRCEIGEGRPSSGRTPAQSRTALLTDRSRLSGANRRSAALWYHYV